MVLKYLTYLLIGALLCTHVDDLQAACTPDVVDDVLAAQDNEYLLAVPDNELKPAPDEDTPSFHKRIAGASGLLALAEQTSSPDCLPFVSLAADPLWVLMSIQC